MFVRQTTSVRYHLVLIKTSLIDLLQQNKTNIFLYKKNNTKGKIVKKTKQAQLQPTTTLTICYFQLSFGEDAASDRQCLADVVASVCSLHAHDGQISAGWDGEAAVGLLWLVGKQQVLCKQTIRRKVEHLAELRFLWRWSW